MIPVKSIPFDIVNPLLGVYPTCKERDFLYSHFKFTKSPSDYLAFQNNLPLVGDSSGHGDVNLPVFWTVLFLVQMKKMKKIAFWPTGRHSPVSPCETVIETDSELGILTSQVSLSPQARRPDPGL